jgi:hypothetical protein
MARTSSVRWGKSVFSSMKQIHIPPPPFYQSSSQSGPYPVKESAKKERKTEEEKATEKLKSISTKKGYKHET